MSEQTESTTYQKGFYDKLAPELLEAAYAYEEFISSRRDRVMYAAAVLAFSELEKAKNEKLTYISSDEGPNSSNEKIDNLISVIESYGTQKDLKELTELVELRSKLLPGEYVLSGDDKLYRVADAGREMVFTFANPSGRDQSIKHLAGWTAFGRQENSDEVVGFPVNSYDTVGSEAIKEEIHKWVNEVSRSDRTSFDIGSVERNIDILNALGDTDGVELIRTKAGRQSIEELEVGNQYRRSGPSERVFELLEFVNPDKLKQIFDARARHIVTIGRIDPETITFYGSFLSYKKALEEDNDEPYPQPINPLEILDLYRSEYERGELLLESEKNAAKS